MATRGVHRALTLGLAFLAAGRTAYGCPGNGRMFTVLNTNLNLGNRPVGSPFPFSIPAVGTSDSWPPGVRFTATLSGPGTLSNFAAQGYSPGQSFNFVGNITPTGSGANNLTFNILPICNPDFAGSSTGFTFNYVGTGGGPPPPPAGGGPNTFSTNNNSGVFGDPISTATGELLGFDDAADLILGGLQSFRLHRYYASFLKANGITSALGNNWMHNFDVKLAVSGTNATVTLFRGKKVSFTLSGGNWQISGRERITYQLASAGSGYRFLDPVFDRIYVFSGAGALTAIEDRNGNTLTVTQSPSGAGPERVSDGLGRVLTFNYTGTKLTRVADQTGRSVSFTHTGDELSTATDANGKRRTYAYGAGGTLTSLITAEMLPAGNKPFTQEYDAQGRVQRQTDSRGNFTRLEYVQTNTNVSRPLFASYTQTHDATGNLTRLIDAAGQTAAFAFDGSNRLTGATNRLGDRTSTTFHEPSGNPASITDEEGNTTRYAYAAQRQGPFTFYNLTGLTYSDGATLSFSYDASGNLLSVTDQAGRTWSSTYNTRGQVLTATNPSDGVTTFAYSDDATLASVRTDSGDTSAYGYDSVKRPTQLTHPDSSLIRWTYDSRGNLARATDERGNSVSYAYDENNNARSVTDAANASSSATYDGDERLASVTDPVAKTTRYTYDANGLMESVTNAAGNRASFRYDNQQRMTSAVDAAGKGETLTYDREDRVTAASDALSRTVRFTRDKLGRVTRTTTANGENIDTAYDRLGQVVSTTDPLVRTTRFSYDGRGLIASVTRPLGVAASIERAGMGQLSKLTDPNGSAWTYNYDRQGRLASRVDPLDRRVSYSYDNRQRIARTTHPDGSVDYTYDASGNLIRRSYSDGTDLRSTFDVNNRMVSGDGLSLGYDAAGRLISSNGLTIGRDDAGRIASVTYAAGKTVRYSYDTRGLLTSVTDWIGGTTTLAYDDAAQLVSITFPNGILQQYGYDRNGRVTSIQLRRGSASVSSIAVTRDAAGQITSSERTAATAADPAAGSLPLAYDAAHQVAGSTYDGLSRLTASGQRTYAWDGASRLKSYSGADGSATFTYDGAGLRISRTDGGATQNYVLNYARALPTVDVVRSGNADLRYYIWLPDGVLLYSVEASGNARRFHHFDETGSATHLTNEAGQVTDTYGISPYGETVTRTGATENPFTFQGAFGVMQEGATGLYYARARYYDSATARFLSRDPLPALDPRGVNPYQYAYGNPQGFADPSGLAPGAGTGDWRYIETMYRRGYTKGCASNNDGNRTFSPTGPLTRGEMAVFVIRAKMNSVFPTATSGAFTSAYAPMFDVPANVVQYGSISPINVLPYLEKLFVGSTYPPLGAVNGSFAPLSTVTSAGNRAPIPRFADTSTSSNIFTINPCRTNLLYPFVTNQAGFDTGLAISNTSSDPFGTAGQTGSCQLNYYGGTTGGGAQTTPAVSSGATYTSLANSSAPNFQGYIIAQCNFQYAHGYAFISDLGARNLAMGYLALIIPDPARTSSPCPSEVLGH